MKKIKLFLILLVTSLGLGQCTFAQNSLLWEVQSPEGKTSYLFGTYHLVGSDYLKSHELVSKAYSQSSTVVVETLIDSSKLMEVAMMGMMQGNTLQDFYDSTQFANMDKQFQLATGIPLSNMATLKPITIAMYYSLSIAQEELAKSELNFSGNPIDLYFANEAERNGLNVVALETMMEQMEILYNSDPLEEQAEMLLELMQDDEAVDLSIELLTYYQKEDLQAMKKLSEEQEDTYGDMAILLDDRNTKWISTLTPLLNEGDAFIAVGALHLPGEQGLIELLREAGYTLKPAKS